MPKCHDEVCEETNNGSDEFPELRVAHDHVEGLSCFDEERTELLDNLKKSRDQRSITQDKSCRIKSHFFAMICILDSFIDRCEYDFPHGGILNELMHT